MKATNFNKKEKSKKRNVSLEVLQKQGSQEFYIHRLKQRLGLKIFLAARELNRAKKEF